MFIHIISDQSVQIKENTEFVSVFIVNRTRFRE